MAFEHGTPARAQLHRKDGEPVCDLCQKAENLYMREFRANPRNYRRHRESQKARDLALKELRGQHLDEYQALYAKHLGELRSNG